MAIIIMMPAITHWKSGTCAFSGSNDGSTDFATLTIVSSVTGTGICSGLPAIFSARESARISARHFWQVSRWNVRSAGSRSPLSSERYSSINSSQVLFIVPSCSSCIILQFFTQNLLCAEDVRFYCVDRKPGDGGDGCGRGVVEKVEVKAFCVAFGQFLHCFVNGFYGDAADFAFFRRFSRCGDERFVSNWLVLFTPVFHVDGSCVCNAGEPS